MNREDGFPIADLDVGLFHDPKVIALSRLIHDEAASATCLALYIALILESWGAGDRVTLDDAPCLVAGVGPRLPRLTAVREPHRRPIPSA